MGKGRKAATPAMGGASGGGTARATRDAAQAPAQSQPRGNSHQQAQVSVPAAAPATGETTAAEGAALNAGRDASTRVNPTWLYDVQVALGVDVAHQTGAFNTPTLRAMRAHVGDPKLTAASALQGKALKKLRLLATGEPTLTSVHTQRERSDEADADATTPADAAAQGAGYASWADWKEDWKSTKLLGKSVTGHPVLLARVEAADAWLRRKHTGKSDEEIRAAIGWDGAITGPYDTDITKGKSHLHTMGLALDIEPGDNPWIFRGKKDRRSAKDKAAKGAALESDDWYERFFEICTQMYGGTALTASQLHQTGKEKSTEELYAVIAGTNEAVKRYLALAKLSDAEIEAELLLHGYAAAGIDKEVAAVKSRAAIFHDAKREQADDDQIMDMSQDMVTALRDAGGLAWGAADISGNENGDFMHFDCRNDGVGRKVYNAGAAAQKKKAEEAKEAAKAAKAKAAATKAGAAAK
ncbi:MAG: hypothetical protein ACOZNI_07140 [Myxococcota bacterium]